MAGHRKEAEAFALKWIKALAPQGKTADYYKERFAKMSDEEFEQFIKRLETGEEFLVLYAPNFASGGLTVENNLEIAKKLGHEFFQPLIIGQRGDVPAYKTPVKYLVVDLPVRRTSQLLTKKISIPKDNKKIDMFTGQVAGSKKSRISYPEVQVMASMGLDHCVEEFMKYRGGDLKGFNAMNTLISRQGGVSIKTLSNYASGVESTKTLKTFLTAAMLSSTL